MMSRSVVVQHDPVRQRRRKLLGGVVVVAAFLFGIAVGGFSCYGLYWSVSEENWAFQERLVVHARQLEELQQWQVNNQTRREIDSAALEMVRKELAAQQEMIAELERGIRFYKSLMAPGELAEGLNIRSIDMIAGEEAEAGRFQFRVLVQQSARKHELMTGTLKVSVVGENAGEPAEFDLSDLSLQVPKADIRLRFKYFQAIDGELQLPEGFVPQLLRVSAKSTKPRRSEVSEEFPWSIQEKLSHVGQ
jgi:hypothetical protein